MRFDNRWKTTSIFIEICEEKYLHPVPKNLESGSYIFGSWFGSFKWFLYIQKVVLVIYSDSGSGH